MDRIRQWLTHIGAQLSVLTVSQRVAIGLCAALAGGSLLWLVQWSARPEMVPLVMHDFTYDELDAAEQSLRSNGIAYEILGATRIYVRPAERHNALRLLHSAEALPEGSLFDMASVVADSNPFQSPEARAYAQTYAKGNELAKIIATSPAVQKASVLLNPVTRRRLGGVSDIPTASVTVTLARGVEMTHEMVEGFAKLVAGAVAGLQPYNVYITDARTLRSYTLPQSDDAASFDVLNLVKRHEEHYRAKILTKLADVPGVQVAVTVELDTSKRITQNVKHDVPQPKIETSNSTEQSAGSSATEPGVQANLGTALTAGAAGQTQSTEQTMVENFEPKLTQTETIEQLPFAVRKITAAVGIPRSFVVGVLRAKHPDATDDIKDDDPRFVAERDAQVGRVRGGVQRIIMGDPKDVEVDVYPDLGWATTGSGSSLGASGAPVARSGAAGADSGEAGTFGLLSGYAPQAGLAMLAVASLILMARIVRRSADVGRRSPVRSSQGPLGDDSDDEQPILTVGAIQRGRVGRAQASESMLTGKEVDPQTLRYQELGREVSRMVEDDPAGSADLIRRWLTEA